MSQTALAFASLYAPYSSVSLSQVLRDRRIFVSQELERVCTDAIQPRILSVCNGSMREADSVLPGCVLRGGAWVAVDTDGVRLAELKREYRTNRLRCVQASVLDGGLDVEGMEGETGFHCVYALNLLSELSDPAARQFLKRMRRWMRRGGTALLSTFTPEAIDAQWQRKCPPFLRDEHELAALTSGLENRLRGQASWCDESGMVVYLQLEAE